MRAVGAKRAVTLAARRELLAREHGRPPCARQRVCGNAADDPHEIVRRSQADSAADVTLIVWLCRRCHDWVGEHPDEAAAEGLHMTGAEHRRRIREDADGAIVYVMPRPPSDRKPVTVRLARDGIAAIEARAEAAGVPVADMHRAMLAFAQRYAASGEFPLVPSSLLRSAPRQSRPTPKPSQRGTR